MPEDEHRRYQEELTAYLLDALAPDEMREFQAHLAGCARCKTEERWFQAAVEMLPSSVEQLEPPPGLRKRLMRTVRAEADDRTHASERPAHRRRWLLSLRPAAAAIASVAVVAAGLAGYLIGQDGGGVTTTTVKAEATPAEPSARASLVRSGDAAVLKIGRLPVQRAGRVYEVWLQRGRRVEPSSLFVVNNDGTGAAAIPESLEGVQAVMVSQEPRGGSSAPTSKPVLVAKL